MGYVFGAIIIGLLGWFSYKNIVAIVKARKESKLKKQELEKTQPDKQKED